MTEPPPNPDRLFHVASGFMAAKHLMVASEVGLFAALAKEPRTCEQLGTTLGIPARTARLLGDALVTLGVLIRAGDTYANGPEAAAHLAGDERSGLRPLMRFWNRISYPAWEDLEQSVRSGAPATAGAIPTAEQAEILIAGIEASTRAPAQALAELPDFDHCRSVIDLGGGTGSFLVPLLQRRPSLGGVLFELPPVAQLARRALATSTVGNRVVVEDGDFLRDPIPGGHDAVLIAHVAHVLEPQDNRTLLGRVRETAKPDARLHYLDYWTNSTRTDPPLAALMAGEFLLLAGGDTVSAHEAQGWLAQTGWTVLHHRPLAGATSVITAAPAG